MWNNLCIEPKWLVGDSYLERDTDHICWLAEMQAVRIFLLLGGRGMKTLAAIGALLLASSAVQAQYSFEYGGKTIRIDPDRGTVSIPGVFDNTGRRSKRARPGQDAAKKQTPDQAKANPQASVPSPAAAPSPTPAAAEPASAPPPANAPAASTVNANVAPADTAPPARPAQPIQTEGAAPAAAIPPQEAPAVSPVPPAVAAATAPSVPAPKPSAQAATPSPVGLWLTEEKEGKVRIEQCGANLCGYSVDPKSNENGEQVLINMKPGRDSKWSGRILDPSTGSTYESTIALKGSDTLRIQGCAFGGMFCGGQTWSRLN
jgi:uncharacterized protein (DUF2147 family)